MAKKILVVDDEPHIVGLLKTRLTANQYEVITAKDGIDCLQKVAAHKPDLIILDIMMPHMTGYDAVSNLRSVAMNTPVIIISAKRSMMESFSDYNISAFIPKPFDSLDLIKKVEEVIGPAVGTKKVRLPAGSKGAVVIKGVDQFIVSKLLEFFEGEGFSVLKAFDEEDVLHFAKNDNPEIILMQYWEDLEMADITTVYKELKKFYKKIDQVWVYCLESLLIEASKEIPANRMLGFNESADLIHRIRKYVLRQKTGNSEPSSKES